jgi:hypothetical protein
MKAEPEGYGKMLVERSGLGINGRTLSVKME